MKVKKILSAGLGYNFANTDELLNLAGYALDKASSHDILGEILFQGEDDKFYVCTVEAVIGEANPEYVKDFLEREA